VTKAERSEEDVTEVVKEQTQQYLIKNAVLDSFRFLYGDKAATHFTRIAQELAEQLQKRLTGNLLP
jgi:hypothetical protein